MPMMEKNLPISRDFARLGYGYVKDCIRDNTLNAAQLEIRCPLNNGRHDCTPISTARYPNGLNKMPVELLVEVLLLLDIPSITRFRSLNRQSMAIVNSVRQYSAIINHCPDVIGAIGAIVSLQADGFDRHTLYNTLSSIRCSTCNRFGNYLYLVNCCRVCYNCFTARVEYFPLTTQEASKFFTPDANSRRKTSARKLLELANPPSILSIPGWYCSTWINDNGGYRPKRVRLYDGCSVDVGLSSVRLPGPELDRTTRELKRYMGIISTPLLLDDGRQVDHGFFCLGCLDKDGLGENGLHFRTKYTTEEMAVHIAQYGVVEKDPRLVDIYMHVPKDKTAL